MAESTGDTRLEHGQRAPTPLGLRSQWRWWQGLAVAIGLGFAIGLLTLIGQGHLPGAWQHLANTGGPWLVGAFFIGAFMPTWRWAAATGLVALLGCLLGYYVAAQVIVDASSPVGMIAFWVGTALVGGPLFGVAGYWWRGAHGWRDAQAWGQWRRAVGAGLLGAVIVAEGLYLLQIVPADDRPAGWVEVAVGLIVPLLLGRSTRDRLLGLLALLPALLLGLVGFALFVLVYTVLY
jgi:hypothetical protein